MSKVKRNGNIEILRFVFSIFIILLHFNDSIFKNEFFEAGYLGVEFFFIITGVFLGKKLKAEKEKHQTESFGLAAKEGAEYVWKRICSVYPYFFLASLIGFSARVAIGINTLNASELITFLGDFGLVSLLGPSNILAVSTIWYLAALFFALLVIYPFARKYYDAFVYSFAMIFPPVIIGYFIRTVGSLFAINERLFDFFNLGILRAIAMISIGFVVNELTDRVKELPVNRLNRFVFTACELTLYPVLFAYLTFVERCKSDYLMVILMAFLLIITLSEKSCLYGKFDNGFSAFLGKSSMIIFMTHDFWVRNIDRYSTHLPGILQRGAVTDLILGFALTFATGAVVYFGGNLLRSLFRKGKAALFAPPKETV